MKKDMRIKRKSFFQIVICIVTISVCLFITRAYDCGPGVQPYVPVYSGAQKSSGNFILFDKGVTDGLLNVKKLQPIIRNIVFLGNEREDRRSSKTEQKSENIAADSTAADSDQPKEDKYRLILNLDRLH